MSRSNHHDLLNNGLLYAFRTKLCLEILHDRPQPQVVKMRAAHSLVALLGAASTAWAVDFPSRRNLKETPSSPIDTVPRRFIVSRFGIQYPPLQTQKYIIFTVYKKGVAGCRL